MMAFPKHLLVCWFLAVADLAWPVLGLRSSQVDPLEISQAEMPNIDMHKIKEHTTLQQLLKYPDDPLHDDVQEEIGKEEGQDVGTANSSNTENASKTGKKLWRNGTTKVFAFPIISPDHWSTHGDDGSTGLAALEVDSKASSWTESMNGPVAKLRADPAFMPDFRLLGPARSASQNCSDWKGNGFLCEIEYPEHALVRKWMPADAKVMEFGARFGTTTCEIAKQLGNSGMLVAVEPDKSVWADLELNLKSHNCNAHTLRGVLSNKTARISSSNGYATRTQQETAPNPSDQGEVAANYRFDEIEEASGITFDTLLIDCEGCAQFMMSEIGPKIQSQINLLIIEADGDYKEFLKFVEASGLEKVDELNDCDRSRTGASPESWCGDYLQHYVFKRRNIADTQ